jgi:hypothetical protein
MVRDGAVHSFGGVAGELPELIEALHRPLGEIIDIGINWSASEGLPDLNSISYGRQVDAWLARQASTHHGGCRASLSREAADCAPHDDACLGWMVLRRAAPGLHNCHPSLDG